MGKGDFRTKRGKIFRGSYGNRRKRKKTFDSLPPDPPTPSANNIKDVSAVEWYEAKNYLHIGRNINKGDIPKVMDEEFVKKYNFYPLIHRTSKQRKYLKQVKDGKTIRSHYDFEKKKSSTKIRHIFYANHLDNLIYSYYAKIKIGSHYEKIVKSNPKLDEAVLAYRKIKQIDNKKGKSNLHFAKETFDLIKNKTDCAILALDIKGFFDSLDHKLLLKAWTKLITGNEKSLLPPDHKNVYNSLINFSYVEETTLLQYIGINHIKSNKKRNKLSEHLRSYFKNNKEFREKIVKSGKLKRHKYYEEQIAKAKGKGIPQGTAISAILANIYLLDFDKKMIELLEKCNGDYRRYSDDILIICPLEYFEKIESEVSKLITSSKCKLIIQEKKTERFVFDSEAKKIIDLNNKKNLIYLGLEFDGKNIRLKSQTLAKFHRRRKAFIKNCCRKANHNPKCTNIWTSEIFNKYTSSGTRNFISYAKRAFKIIGDIKIKKQIKKHNKQARAYLNSKKHFK